MVGEKGEVWLVDWGLVGVQYRTNPVPSTTTEQAETLALPKSLSIITDRSKGESHGTILGAVSGTPAYMSPEQSGGYTTRYSDRCILLGAVLYETCVVYLHIPLKK